MKNHLYHSRYKLCHVTKQLPLMHKKVADGFLFSFFFLNLSNHLNSASLSMLPWPKPAIWPSVPPDASSEVLAKEKVNSQYGTCGIGLAKV